MVRLRQSPGLFHLERSTAEINKAPPDYPGTKAAYAYYPEASEGPTCHGTTTSDAIGHHQFESAKRIRHTDERNTTEANRCSQRSGGRIIFD